MKFKKTKLNECFIIQNQLSFDARGKFVKNFHFEKFLKTKKLYFKEQFHTTSKKNVIRGIHFQTPPFDHYKLVSCLKGKILDVVIDLRKKSNTYKQILCIELSESNHLSLLIPNGFGHGFLSLTESLVYYNTTTPHSPKHDSGILWSSIDFDWPIKKPIISRRDKKFSTIDKFRNPF